MFLLTKKFLFTKKFLYYFSGSRATSIFQFGFIALDLISIVKEDSGEYVCRVISSTGVAESRATLGVTRKFLLHISIFSTKNESLKK